MPNALKTSNIVLHCSAGFGNRASIERYWKQVLGWSDPGYHRLIGLNGEIHKLADFGAVTNGVRSWNSKCIHICYIGGVENLNTKEDPIWKALDTRNAEQIVSIHTCIQEAIAWLKSEGRDVTKNLGIVGHRDFSADLNANGIIESNERIKECPSFEAMREFSYLYASPDRYNKLPYN